MTLIANGSDLNVDIRFDFQLPAKILPWFKWSNYDWVELGSMNSESLSVKSTSVRVILVNHALTDFWNAHDSLGCVAKVKFKWSIFVTCLVGYLDIKEVIYVGWVLKLFFVNTDQVLGVFVESHVWWSAAAHHSGNLDFLVLLKLLSSTVHLKSVGTEYPDLVVKVLFPVQLIQDQVKDFIHWEILHLFQF